MMNITDDIKQIDRKQWLKFVETHPQGNVFQTPYWYDIYEQLKYFTPIVVCAKENSQIVGILLAIIYHEGGGIVGKLTARSIIMGGPLVISDNTDIAEKIISKYSDIVSSKAIYSQFRNLSDVRLLDEAYVNNQLKYIPHLDIHHDLSISKDELLAKISKNKRRNVSKSINKGVEFKEICHNEEIDKCVELIQMTYRRISLPCPDKLFFQTFIKYFNSKNILKIFAVKLDERIIGTRWELCFNGVVYDWYAGADDEYRNLYPNDILPYNILLWGQENGYKTFDFGGAGKPGVPYGVREHKMKFGGELVEYGRYEKVHKPILMFLGKIGLYFYKKIKK